MIALSRVLPSVAARGLVRYKHGSTSRLTTFNYLKRLPQPSDKCIATYVWIDGTGEHLRNKARTLNFIPSRLDQLPEWNYDGSSTYQARGGNSDTFMRPVAMYEDPFLPKSQNKLVLCDTYLPDGSPTPSNRRNSCAEAMEKVSDQDPWFGIEQEYTFLDLHGRPYGWPEGGYPAPQGPYYCGVGYGRVTGRDVVDVHYRACLFAGINISGTNAEVMLSQWEYQVTSKGVAAPDELWMSRYLLQRVAEDYGIVVTFDPKPMAGDWNGAGGHVNFSTEAMRAEGGMAVIEQAIEKLSKRHKTHITNYDPKLGKDNERRLTGAHETSSIHEFSSGVANRGCSVRIPRACADAGKGYLEDRRPASNMDPYVVTDLLVRTCLLDETD
ncbi:glutamine synthetase 1, mitochondrial-like [Galendromus occidentalis]|uniref:Glutamine synthetase n=1 Tax=Galendromus occidentalis TaxID=34638 RepID=A0AAJ6QXR1_9ACAR|nr:glutamine synthetase 1, mitochondrial-like [Galendromus occidentalis]